MKRVLKDYSAIKPEHLALIELRYPDGFDHEDLISILDAKGKFIRCLEIIDNDVNYLFKIDQDMLELIDEHTDDSFTIGDIEDIMDEEI